MQAFDILKYPENLMQALMRPRREITVEMIITRDDGRQESFLGYRVQHDDSRGPFKGGLRFHPQVDLDDVRRCSQLLPAFRLSITVLLSCVLPRVMYMLVCWLRPVSKLGRFTPVMHTFCAVLMPYSRALVV